MAVVRLATFDDVAAMLEISNSVIETSPANFALAPESLEQWQHSYRDTHQFHPWLVGDVDAEIVAFAKASPWKSRCAYRWTAEVSIYVAANHQGKGIARALYSQLLEIMRVQGWRSVLAGITQPNEASVKLHESFGFRRAALFERVGYKLGQWWDVGYWMLDLDPARTAPTDLLPVDLVASRILSD